MKEGGQLPAFGPVDVKGASATSGLINGQSYLFTGHGFTGRVYQEDDATVSDEDGNVPTMKIRTRRFTPGRGYDNQGRVNNVSIIVDADGSSTTGKITSTFFRQNEGEAVTSDSVITDRHTTTGGIITLWQEMFGDTFDLEVQKTGTADSDHRLHTVSFDTDDADKSTAT